MYTTLNKILEHNPCNQHGHINYGGWNLLLHNLNKSKPDNRRLSFKRILKSNGIKDAIWALRTLDYIDICMFNYDVGMLVIDNFESVYPDDNRPRKALEAIVLFKNGQITKSQLDAARIAAMSAAVWTEESALSAVLSAVWSATDSAWSAEDSAYNAADSAKRGAWKEIENIFIKHFC